MKTLRRLQPIFLVLALIFVVVLLYRQWSELRAYTWQLNPFWLFASALLLLASWAMEIGIWRSLLHLVGGRLSAAVSVRIWFVSAVMRYIPGNIWQPLSMTVQCAQKGIRPEATLTSIILYQLIILLAVVPIATLYVSVTGNLGMLTGMLQTAAPWLLALALLGVIVFVIRPDLLITAVNWGLYRIGREALDVKLSASRLLMLLLFAIINWVLWGGSFAALTFGLGVYSPADVQHLAPHLVAAYPIAYAIGFVSLITPSGFGVREGAFYLLLSPLMGGGVVTVVALAMRVWTTVGELVMAGLSVLMARDMDESQLEPLHEPRQI